MKLKRLMTIRLVNFFDSHFKKYHKTIWHRLSEPLYDLFNIIKCDRDSTLFGFMMDSDTYRMRFYLVNEGHVFDSFTGKLLDLKKDDCRELYKYGIVGIGVNDYSYFSFMQKLRFKWNNAGVLRYSSGHGFGTIFFRSLYDSIEKPNGLMIGYVDNKNSVDYDIRVIDSRFRYQTFSAVVSDIAPVGLFGGTYMTELSSFYVDYNLAVEDTSNDQTKEIYRTEDGSHEFLIVSGSLNQGYFESGMSVRTMYDFYPGLLRSDFKKAGLDDSGLFKMNSGMSPKKLRVYTLKKGQSAKSLIVDDKFDYTYTLFFTEAYVYVFHFFVFILSDDFTVDAIGWLLHLDEDSVAIKKTLKIFNTALLKKTFITSANNWT